MLLQAFDPPFAREQNIGAVFVRRMVSIKPLAEEKGLLAAMEGELHAYLAGPLPARDSTMLALAPSPRRFCFDGATASMSSPLGRRRPA